MRSYPTLLLIVLLTACGEHNVPEKHQHYTVEGRTITEYTIGRCTYLGHVTGDATFLTHNGECKNPAHACPCAAAPPER